MNVSKNTITFDELQMYCGYDYQVNDYISIHTPTVGEIMKFGEQKYFSVVSTLTCIPSDMKSTLFDIGIDYEKYPDFELFMLMARNLTSSETNLLFGDLDLSKMQRLFDKENETVVLGNLETGQIIDELAYQKIVGYIRKLHNLKPKVEHALNKTTKKILIQLDREKIKKSKDKKWESQLMPLISAMMRYPGFKYKSNELMECSIYEFMDTVQGAQIYISSTSLLQGCYSGMIDTSKINKKEFNWMRNIDEN